jgi:hypothetical protein
MMLDIAGLIKLKDVAFQMPLWRDLIVHFITEMREAVGKLLEGYREVQRRLTLIENLLPKRLGLPVVRFRDALNQVELLQFDLVQDWTTFTDILAGLFRNRQGLHRVKMGLYFITHVRTGQKLKCAHWSSSIKPDNDPAIAII